MRIPILFAALGLACGLSAQTYFYINTLGVQPEAPTTADAINLYIEGALSGSGSYIVEASASVQDFQVTVTIIAADQGGLTVLVPHTEVIPLGMLAAGTYTITVTGNAVLDLAPVPDHTFVVSAGGGTGCEGLEVVSVQYHAFTDTIIQVHLTNSGPEIFSYPGLILFTAQGDTVAIEAVNFFGIAEESTHPLLIHADADLTNPSFSGYLEVWTGFYEELACTIPVNVQLCPPQACHTLTPYVQNSGGATLIYTFQYTITNQDGPVATGSLPLTADQQFAMDEVCLPPGQYSIQVESPDPLVGQPQLGVNAPGVVDGPTVAVHPGSQPLAFTFFGPCISPTQSTPARPAQQVQLILLQGLNELVVQRPDGVALGHMLVHDAQGRTIYSSNAPGSSAQLALDRFAPGLYTVRVNAAAEAPIVRKFLVTR
jgi:hypothetical protein